MKGPFTNKTNIFNIISFLPAQLTIAVCVRLNISS